MKIILPLLGILLLLFAYSCKAKKAISKETTAAEIVTLENKMKSEGYSQAIVHLSDKEGDCPVTLKIDDPRYSYPLDPINIADEFKKEGLVVWIKFGPLRMQNRCENTQPIQLSEIKIQ